MQNDKYLKQAELLLRILPYVAREEVFALKGGTAINFFWRDFPRLSVDIDLAYTSVESRDISLINISDRLVSIEARIQNGFPQVHITQKKDREKIVGLIINSSGSVVKIEVNTIIRGSVFPVVNKKLSDKVEKQFELTVSTNTLSFEDLLGGKICAALDRQHPRDLFDIKLLFDKEGLTERIRKAFIVYLISHNRPLVELLNPGIQDIKQVFENEFSGMTTEDVKLSELTDTRTELIKNIKASLTEDEIKFLLSFKNNKPQWDLLGVDNIKDLPGVRYKLLNINRMNPEKHKQAYEKLRQYLLS